MMYINSRSWIFLFLFYGAVCFLMGFFGYWLKTDIPKASTAVQVPISQEQIGDPQNLLVESEEYLTKFLTRINLSLSNVPNTEPVSNDNLWKTNEAVPVSANESPAKLVFCFPEGDPAGAFQSLIARYRFDLKTSFAGVKEIRVLEAGHWETKLGEILDREQPLVLIGLNIARNGFSGSGRMGVKIHLYLAMADQRHILIPQIIAKFSENLYTFTLEKQKLGDRGGLEIIWTEATEEHLAGLKRNMESLIKTLEQVPELRTAKKI